MDANKPHSKPCWYHLTPDRLIFGMLLVECLLGLWDWLHGPVWHKGYAVLMCVAVAATALFVMLLWFVVAWFFQRRFRFSIRSLLVLTIAVAVPCSWLGYEMERAKAQRAGLATMETISQKVPSAGFGFRQALPPFPPATPRWLWDLLDYGGPTWQSLLSDNFVINELSLAGISITDRELEYCVKRLPDLEQLSLRNTPITDAGLKHMKGLTGLKELNIGGTRLTELGVRELRQVLPRCRIWTDLDADGSAGEGYDRLLDFATALPILIESLKDDKSSVRQAAATALGKSGPKAEAAVPTLTVLLNDENDDVREAARDALEKIRGFPPETPQP